MRWSFGNRDLRAHRVGRGVDDGQKPAGRPPASAVGDVDLAPRRRDRRETRGGARRDQSRGRDHVTAGRWPARRRLRCGRDDDRGDGRRIRCSGRGADRVARRSRENPGPLDDDVADEQQDDERRRDDDGHKTSTSLEGRYAPDRRRSLRPVVPQVRSSRHRRWAGGCDLARHPAAGCRARLPRHHRASHHPATRRSPTPRPAGRRRSPRALRGTLAAPAAGSPRPTSDAAMPVMRRSGRGAERVTGTSGVRLGSKEQTYRGCIARDQAVCSAVRLWTALVDLPLRVGRAGHQARGTVRVRRAVRRRRRYLPWRRPVLVGIGRGRRGATIGGHRRRGLRPRVERRRPHRGRGALRQAWVGRRRLGRGRRPVPADRRRRRRVGCPTVRPRRRVARRGRLALRRAPRRRGRPRGGPC